VVLLILGATWINGIVEISRASFVVLLILGATPGALAQSASISVCGIFS